MTEKKIGIGVAEIFEDFMAKNGMTIDNPERNEDPNAAILYGTQWGDLVYLIDTEIAQKVSSTIHPIINSIRNTVVPGSTKADLIAYLDTVYCNLDLAVQTWRKPISISAELLIAFKELLAQNNGSVLSVAHEDGLSLKIADLLEAEIFDKLKDYLKNVIDYSERDSFDIVWLKAFLMTQATALEEFEQDFYEKET